jgi:hypothetical protein
VGLLGLLGLLGLPVMAEVIGASGAGGGRGAGHLRACALGGVWALGGLKNGSSDSSINLSGLGSSSRLYIEKFSEAFLVSISIRSSTDGGR